MNYTFTIILSIVALILGGMNISLLFDLGTLHILNYAWNVFMMFFIAIGGYAIDSWIYESRHGKNNRSDR